MRSFPDRRAFRLCKRIGAARTAKIPALGRGDLVRWAQSPAAKTSGLFVLSSVSVTATKPSSSSRPVVLIHSCGCPPAAPTVNCEGISVSVRVMRSGKTSVTALFTLRWTPAAKSARSSPLRTAGFTPVRFGRVSTSETFGVCPMLLNR